jgi:mRNA interferase YafQ
MLELFQSARYKKHLKNYKHKKEILQELSKVIELLVKEQPLPAKYKNHKLTGNYIGMSELHIKPDDLLVYYKIENKSIVLVAI